MPITNNGKNLLQKINKYIGPKCDEIESLHDFRNKFGGPSKTSDGKKIDPKYVNFLQADNYDELEDKRLKYYSRFPESEFAQAVCIIFLQKGSSRLAWDDFYQQMAELGLKKEGSR
jgi:hypothetical protein